MILNRFASNAAKSLGVGFFAVLPALILPAVLARLLPPADLATWLYAFSIGTYVLSFHLGVGPATSTLIARETSDPVARASILFTALGLTCMASAVATIVLVGSATAGYFDANADATLNLGQFHRTIALTVIATSLTLPLQTYYAYCTGTFDVGRFVPINLLQKLSMIVLIIAMAYLVGDAISVAMAYVASSALTLLVCARLILRDLAPGRSVFAAQFLPRARSMLVYSIPAALSGLATIPQIGIHSVIVAREAPTAIIAFTALLPVLSLISGMSWSIMGNMLSEFSAGFGARTGDKGTLTPEALQVVQRSTAFLGLFLTVFLVGICALLPILLKWMVGSQWYFDQLASLAAYCCVFLLRLQILPMSLGFYALGRPWLGQIPVWLEAVLSLTLVLLLAPDWGLAGIAASSAIALVANALVTSHLLVASKHTGASPWPLLRSVATAIIAAGLLVIVCQLAMKASVGPGQSLQYFAWVAAAGVGIVALYWFVGLDRSHATEAIVQLARFRDRFASRVERS